MTTSLVLGCGGPTLTASERDFFREVRPWGFILFGRNVESPDQVRGLTEALREAVGREDAPVLTDQEGGRVQRLRVPHWAACPPARAYGRLAEIDLALGLEAASLGGRLIAHDLLSVGITVACAPVLDVPAPDADPVIGDRAFADEPAGVAALGRAFAEVLLAGGVLPVVKHTPGHGRATTDSHCEAPLVTADLEMLESRDFAPFRALADMPMAMTAHVVFGAVDPGRPATLSPAVIGAVIRGRIGFDGLLLSDDIGMGALSGPLVGRTEAALAAGCDLVLHGSGNLAQMAAAAGGARPLRGATRRRADAALARRRRSPEPLDAPAARARLAALVERVAA